MPALNCKGAAPFWTAPLLMRKAQFVIPNETITAISVDPSDNRFLEAAVAGDAICIVSGDNHLLEIKAWRGIPILTAREFLVRLG